MSNTYTEYGEGEQEAVEWLDEQFDQGAAETWQTETGTFISSQDNGANWAGSEDPDVSQAVSSIVNMIPSLVRAIANEEITSRSDAETWLGEMQPSDQSGEVWGAVIGALASAIPAIIPVVRNIVNSARSRTRRQSSSTLSRTTQRQPQPRQQPQQPAPPAGTRRVCRDVPIQQSAQGESKDDFYDLDESLDEYILEESDEAVAALVPLLTQLAPMLVQVLPALIPLFTEIIRSGVPAVTQAVQGMTRTQSRTARTASRAPVRRETTITNDDINNFESHGGEQASENTFEGEPIFLS